MNIGDRQPSKRNLSYYCKLFAGLNVNSSRQRGDAHYKPILVLSVIDLIAQGLIATNQIIVSDDLVNTFNSYWNILTSGSYKGGLHYPFIHLQSDSFWHLEFKSTFNGFQPKTTNKLKEAVEYAYLDNELFDFLKDPVFRQDLIDTLVSVWFSGNQKKLEDLLSINEGFQKSVDLGLDNKDSEPKIVLRKSVIRNTFFRKSIVHIYDYRCAFCRLKVTRNINQNIVDGAHIKSFAEFYDSKIDNGISLCKNHHWAFDQGWFTINDDYKIVVADDLEEYSPNAKPMKDFHDEPILLPASRKYFPRIEALRWHQENKFKVI